jgi:phage shock protein A
MAKATPTAPAEAQSMDELKLRYERLDKRKTVVETNSANAEQSLKDLQEEARKSYGTDDFNELREKFAAMKAENETKRRNYQAELDAIEAALAKVESQVAATENPQSNGSESK